MLCGKIQPLCAFALISAQLFGSICGALIFKVNFQLRKVYRKAKIPENVCRKCKSLYFLLIIQFWQKKSKFLWSNCFLFQSLCTIAEYKGIFDNVPNGFTWWQVIAYFKY